jgi:hypothetical protein
MTFSSLARRADRVLARRRLVPVQTAPRLALAGGELEAKLALIESVGSQPT